MIYFEYKKRDGSVLLSTMSDCNEAHFFNSQEEENIVIGKSRNLFEKTTFGSVRIIIVGNGDYMQYVRTSKRARVLLQIFIDAYSFFVDIEKNNQAQIKEAIELFAHNLISVHTHLKDKVDRILDGDAQRANNYKEQREIVGRKISSDVEKAADDFCQIAKRIDDLEAQIAVFKIMSGIEKNIPANYINANIKKIVLRNMQPFLEAFKEKGIDIVFTGDSEEIDKLKVKLDPKAVMVAFHHFFQNMTKYVLPYSRVVVTQLLDEKSLVVRFSMHSTRIEKEEINLLFCRGYSGENVGKSAGQGIGMFVIKTALEKFRSSLKIEPNYANSSISDGVKYVENNFIFRFPID